MEGKSHIIEMSTIKDFPSTPSMNNHWDLNFSKIFSNTVYSFAATYCPRVHHTEKCVNYTYLVKYENMPIEYFWTFTCNRRIWPPCLASCMAPLFNHLVIQKNITFLVYNTCHRRSDWFFASEKKTSRSYFLSTSLAVFSLLFALLCLEVNIYSKFVFFTTLEFFLLTLWSLI